MDPSAPLDLSAQSDLAQIIQNSTLSQLLELQKVANSTYIQKLDKYYLEFLSNIDLKIYPSIIQCQSELQEQYDSYFAFFSQKCSTPDNISQKCSTPDNTSRIALTREEFDEKWRNLEQSHPNQIHSDRMEWILIDCVNQWQTKKQKQLAINQKISKIITQCNKRLQEINKIDVNLGDLDAESQSKLFQQIPFLAYNQMIQLSGVKKDF